MPSPQADWGVPGCKTDPCGCCLSMKKGLLTFPVLFALYALQCFSSPAAFITACMCGCIRDLGLVEGMGRICTATHTSHTPLSVPIHTPLDKTLPSFPNGRMQRVSERLIFRARIQTRVYLAWSLVVWSGQEYFARLGLCAFFYNCSMQTVVFENVG